MRPLRYAPMTLLSRPFRTKSPCMRISRIHTSTNISLLRPWKLTAKARPMKIARSIANRKSASRNRTPPLRKILASTIPRKNTLVQAATAMIAGDRISAETAVAIAAVEDASASAVDAAVADAHKAAAIFLPPSTRHHNLHKEISARTIPAVATTHAASKAAVSSRATIVARKVRASARLRRHRVQGKTISCSRANLSPSTETSRLQRLPRLRSSSLRFTNHNRISEIRSLPEAMFNPVGHLPAATSRAARRADCRAGCLPKRATKPRHQPSRMPPLTIR